MKTVSIGEFKARLSRFIERIQAGEEFVVTHGRSRKKVFKVSPYRGQEKLNRKLGPMRGKASVTFHDDWEMSDDELLKS